MNAVEAAGLTKTYGETRALDGLDLVVPQGSVIGVLGPNGAGKTTTVKILATLIKADSGSAVVDGIDVQKNPAAVRARIGLTGQYAAVEERLTGLENLEHIGRLSHLSRQEAKSRAEELLGRFDLVEECDRLVSGYSGGMRRRIDIAMSLVSRPSVLFLDEPTTGLDPRSRLAMWDLIKQLSTDGTTTFLTTQYLDEAEALADSIAVIDRGALIAEGTADQLKDRVGGDKLIVTISSLSNLERAAAAVDPLASGRIEINQTRPELVVPIPAGKGVLPKAIRALDECNCEIIDIELRRPSLDDAFLSLTRSSPDDFNADRERP